MKEDEELKGWCDGCNKFVKKLIEFYCRVCKCRVNYCDICFSVASKENKCIDCLEEGL